MDRNSDPRESASVSSPTPERPSQTHDGLWALEETFAAIIIDWDALGVSDRNDVATTMRVLVEALCAAGSHIFIVSATDASDLDVQVAARPAGRGRLFLYGLRSSEVFEAMSDGPAVLVHRRAATAEEDRALDRAVKFTCDQLRRRDLIVESATTRTNGRTITLAAPSREKVPTAAEVAAGNDALALATAAARKVGLSHAHVIGGERHLEIGLTNKSDAALFAARWLAARGITGALVLVAGDDFGFSDGASGSSSSLVIDELDRAIVVSLGAQTDGVADGIIRRGDGPEALISLLDAQVTRHRARRVPPIDPDPAWVLTLPTTRDAERVAEALGALSNGWSGTRASLEEDGVGSSPLFVAAGVYDEHDELLAGPAWTDLELPAAPESEAHTGERSLDLRTGVLARRGDPHSGLCSLRFVSATAPHALAWRAELPRAWLGADELEVSRSTGETAEQSPLSVRQTSSTNAEQVITVAMCERSSNLDRRFLVERLASWSSGSNPSQITAEASEQVHELEIAGFDALLADHREAWARKWSDAVVTIGGDATSELAARFAVFHLLSAAKNTGEAAVGARGLTGDAYAGHVFWDADVFVLPALCAIAPDAARAVLEYRLRRLPVARAAARRLRRDGARFPWESAASGAEVSPTKVRGLHGEVIPIRTGSHEEHIVADVAWAAAHYTSWTGDGFLDGEGGSLVTDTARYWASRIRVDREGHGHIYGVMGPDEYHEVVDDNAFTNVMARWNLRMGATLLERSGAIEEATKWRLLGDSLVDGYDKNTRLYEQFAGYFALEPLVIDQFARPPVAIDVVLGQKRVSGSQLIKQADVLMAHHLIPDEMHAGSLTSCLDFYEPRTAHGSSLSPAISAALFARAGNPERAVELFDLAARLDLDDLTRTTASGVHLATMGGLWQALAHGFLGLGADGEALRVDPRLPGRWSSLSLRIRFRGRRVEVRAEHDRVIISCDSPLTVMVRGCPQTIEPPGTTLTLETSRPGRNPI
jgi:trehalose/maltose hydrolase-like predicted phosphorylase